MEAQNRNHTVQSAVERSRGEIPGFFARRDCGVDTTSGLLEILEFTHFFEHVAFEKDADNHVRKVLKKYIRVVVAVDLVEVNTKEA